MSTDRLASRRVPARVGLVGNPSDGYGGAVFGTTVSALAATVTAVEHDAVRFEGPVGVEMWDDVDDWRQRTATAHSGEQRIISAALAALDRHSALEGGVHLTWETTIPRSVGLAGSSALAVGVVQAVAGAVGVELDRRVVAALALRAERDLLGIAAGWQDRIIQAYDATVLVDAAVMTEVDGVAVPTVSVAATPIVDLVVGWLPDGADGSQGYHGRLRATANRDLVAAMDTLGDLARRAFAADDREQLAGLVSQGWVRRQAVAPLRHDHASLVEGVRALGVAATTPGSGGAVVALCLDADDVDRVTDHLEHAEVTLVSF